MSDACEKTCIFAFKKKERNLFTQLYIDIKKDQVSSHFLSF